MKCTRTRAWPTICQPAVAFYMCSSCASPNFLQYSCSQSGFCVSLRTSQSHTNVCNATCIEATERVFKGGLFFTSKDAHYSRQFVIISLPSWCNLFGILFRRSYDWDCCIRMGVSLCFWMWIQDDGFACFCDCAVFWFSVGFQYLMSSIWDGVWSRLVIAEWNITILVYVVIFSYVDDLCDNINIESS